jgi:hypothetical protein
LSLFAEYGTPGFLGDEGGQISRMLRVSSEVLIDDIGLPVPVVEGSFGILSEYSVFSR